MPKFIKAEDLHEYIRDEAVIYTTSFGLVGMPEESVISLENHYLKQNRPKNLTYYCPSASGNFKDKGIHHLAHEGLLKKYVTGHIGGGGPRIQKLVMENKVEAYNLPQGVLSVLPRYIAGKRGGLFTKVGLNTFVDPRMEGGKCNDISKEDLVEIVNFKEEEWMYYKLPRIDVALLRGNIADEKGNIATTKDGVMLELLTIAQATKACGGIVIVEVENIVKSNSIHPKEVKIPGILVDYILMAKPENHFQTMGTYYNPVYSGDIKVSTDCVGKMKLNEKKIICRRAAMFLKRGDIINLGIGTPEGIANITAEEEVFDEICLTTEGGGIGGVPASGLDFAHTVNAEAIIEQSAQFDYYDGTGVDKAFLGLAQADKKGNLNVSRFNNKPIGCGGFINITQNSTFVVFCGTFTAGELETKIEDGKLSIVKEGKNKKFVDHVEQITFSGDYARKTNQTVYYVTERAVFKNSEEGLELIEIAPGIDLEKDVLGKMGFKPIIKHLKRMPEEIFYEEWGNLKKTISYL
jgi:propionate CoA-transferase